jgi:hypothetical protein
MRNDRVGAGISACVARDVPRVDSIETEVHAVRRDEESGNAGAL